MQNEEGSTEFRIGIDIPVDTDDEEFCCSHFRVKQIENLEKCKNLQKLSIVASCVDEIHNLDNNSNLQHLEIYQGLLKHISSNIAVLTNLKVVDLSFNEIRVIENLDSLIHLEKLYLSNNKISSVEGLENLSNLKVLELGSNKIRSINSGCMRPLKNLEALWLGKNKIASFNDFIPLRFPKLKQLSLQSNRLTKWNPELFSTVAPNLTHIYLGSNRLPDMDAPTLASLNPSCLQEIDLSCNVITRIPHFPHPMSALEELWLNDNQIGQEETFENLEFDFPVLKTIYIERNPVHTQFPLDCRRMILKNAPESLEQIDASMIPRSEIQVRVDPIHTRSILRH